MTACSRYASGESSSPPFPTERSASHQAELVPRPCLVLSQSRRAASSAGPSFLMKASHWARDLPVLAGSAVIQSCIMATPGWTLYGFLARTGLGLVVASVGTHAPPNHELPWRIRSNPSGKG